MSYRERLISIPKEEYNKLKDLTEKEIKLKYNVESLSEFLYEILFDKYPDFHYFGNNESLKIKLKDFFSNIKIKMFKTIKKEELREIVDEFKEIISSGNDDLIQYAKDLNSNDEDIVKFAKYKILKIAEREKQEWDSILSFEYDSDSTIVDSWKFNYDIFNIVYLYKTFDFDNNVLCLYGS